MDPENRVSALIGVTSRRLWRGMSRTVVALLCVTRSAFASRRSASGPRSSRPATRAAAMARASTTAARLAATPAWTDTAQASVLLQGLELPCPARERLRAIVVRTDADKAAGALSVDVGRGARPRWSLPGRETSASTCFSSARSASRRRTTTRSCSRHGGAERHVARAHAVQVRGARERAGGALEVFAQFFRAALRGDRAARSAIDAETRRTAARRRRLWQVLGDRDGEHAFTKFSTGNIATPRPRSPPPSSTARRARPRATPRRRARARCGSTPSTTARTAWRSSSSRTRRSTSSRRPCAPLWCRRRGADAAAGRRGAGRDAAPADAAGRRGRRPTRRRPSRARTRWPRRPTTRGGRGGGGRRARRARGERVPRAARARRGVAAAVETRRRELRELRLRAAPPMARAAARGAPTRLLAPARARGAGLGVRAAPDAGWAPRSRPARRRGRLRAVPGARDRPRRARRA